MTAISLPSAADLTPRSSQFLSLNLCVTKMFVDWQEYEKAIAEAERALAVDLKSTGWLGRKSRSK